MAKKEAVDSNPNKIQINIYDLFAVFFILLIFTDLSQWPKCYGSVPSNHLLIRRGQTPSINVIENPDVVVALPCDQICAATNNPHGTNMVALGPLFKVVPGMISGVKPFEFALDEAISARNIKFNPINITTIEAAFNKDYENK